MVLAFLPRHSIWRMMIAGYYHGEGMAGDISRSSRRCRVSIALALSEPLTDDDDGLGTLWFGRNKFLMGLPRCLLLLFLLLLLAQRRGMSLSLLVVQLVDRLRRRVVKSAGWTDLRGRGGGKAGPERKGTWWTEIKNYIDTLHMRRGRRERFRLSRNKSSSSTYHRRYYYYYYRPSKWPNFSLILFFFPFLWPICFGWLCLPVTHRAWFCLLACFCQSNWSDMEGAWQHWLSSLFLLIISRWASPAKIYIDPPRKLV